MKRTIKIPIKQILQEMTQDLENGCDAHNVKVFSVNHSKHTIEIVSSGSPQKETTARFKATLTKNELEKICDFITKEFK